MYKEFPKSRGLRRSFTVTCGLAEGYGETAKTHDPIEVEETLMNWMKTRAAMGQSFLTGTVILGQVVYAWPDGPGKSGGGHESTAIFSGEISPLYNSTMTDDEVVDLLNDLAEVLGQAFGQTRIYVAYRDEAWIIQKEETATPTGETV